MSQYDIDVSVTLLRHLYGRAAATVAETLFKHGRLTVAQIARQSKLAGPTVQRALVPLVQNRFVLFWAEAGTVHYVASAEHIYNIVRNGLVVAYATELLPETPANGIVKNVLLHGHVRVADFLGAHSGDEAAAAAAALLALVRRGLLEPLERHRFFPDADVYGQIFRRQLAAVPRSKLVSEAKREAAAHAEAQAEFDRLRRAPAPDAALARGGERASVRADAVLAVSYAKFLVLLRNREAVALARARIGAVTAAVYQQLLGCLEPQLKRCAQPADEAVVTTLDVSRHLDPAIDLAVFAATSRKRKSRSRSASHGRHAKRRKHADSSDSTASGSDSASASGTDDSSADSDDNRRAPESRLELINRHLELLAESKLGLLRRAGGKGGGEWAVDFVALADSLRRLEYERIVERRFGTVACRLLRIVRDLGRVDEKLLGQIALLQPKDIRAHLAGLHEIGCFDLQEVPKGNDRAPSRTYYLWYHKPQQAYALILQDVLKTMSRTFQRILEERARCQTLTNKLQREESKAAEVYLSPSEKAELAALHAAEEKDF
ncbi:RNA polymerase III subunit RPC82-domain-containing protein [Dipodascopsis tothii]|uniref:RNA polymerase III subunit RPC82-domain-containing protein n=1 Tax=Dipodascopsis tothii TaxID=44089 RepID=UPI0034CE975C